MSWTWTARKRLVSAFVLLHVAALIAWNLPLKAAARGRVAPLAEAYLLPTGLWQDWGMFAPDPPLSICTLEAVTVDRHGVARTFAFPKLTGLGVASASWRYRHAKYASVVGLEKSAAHREFAARTVLRRLDIPPEAYPVDVQLVYQVRDIPPPGEPIDPEAPARTHVLGTYRFPNRAEADP